MLLGYASCKSDQDTGNAVYLDMRGKAVGIYVAASSAAAFATPEIIAIPEEKIAQFFTAAPELGVYRRSIYRIRRMAAHTLSAAEETLLAAAGEMAQTPDNVCSVFRNADLSFPAVKDAAGAEHALTNETFVPLLESADRVLRENAFRTYYSRLGEYREHRRRDAGRAVQAAPLLRAGAEISHDACRRAGRDGGAAGGIHESYRGRARQYGQDVPLRRAA